MIVYERRGKEFFKTGELTPRTQSVRISIDGRIGASIWRVKEAIAVISEAIETRHAHANRYEIIEAAVDSLDRVAKRAANLVKAKNKKSLLERLGTCGRFLAQQGKDGRYSIIDVLNHDNELFISRFGTESEAQKFIDEFLAEH